LLVLTLKEAEAHVVEQVERVQIGADRFGAFHMHDAGDDLGVDGCAHLGRRAAYCEIIGRSARHPVQQPGHGQRHRLRLVMCQLRRHRQVVGWVGHQLDEVGRRAIRDRRHKDGEPGRPRNRTASFA